MELWWDASFSVTRACLCYLALVGGSSCNQLLLEVLYLLLLNWLLDMWVLRSYKVRTTMKKKCLSLLGHIVTELQSSLDPQQKNTFTRPSRNIGTACRLSQRWRVSAFWVKVTLYLDGVKRGVLMYGKMDVADRIAEGWEKVLWGFQGWPVEFGLSEAPDMLFREFWFLGLPERESNEIKIENR